MPAPIKPSDKLRLNRQALEAARQTIRDVRAGTEKANAATSGQMRVSPEDASAKLVREAEVRKREHATNEQIALEDYGRLIGEQHELLDILADGWDPTNNTEKLSDGYPILMFPLRVETRFMTGDAGPQLWVRVFPDACLIDSFEALLSESELASAKQFWVAFYGAANDEGGERAAWRTLVGSHGAGRAAWIVSQFRPPEGTTPPVRSPSEEGILILAVQTPPAPDVALAIATYWIAVWNARGDAAALTAARVALEAAIDGARDVISRIPFGIDPARGAAGLPPDAPVQFFFLPLPPDPPVRSGAWTESARVRLLPERLAVICYSGKTKAIEQVGAPIPWPLQAGPDPETPPSPMTQGGDIDGGPELHWLFDFDEAVARGLGFRIDLTADQAQTGFDRLLIGGVRLGAEIDETTELVEEWITHQHHSKRGFTFVPQGTATNNTEGAAAGYWRGDDPDATFPLVFGGAASFALSDDPHVRPDGQWFADLLGIDPAKLQTIAGAAGAEAAEARAMNEALFPATLGYMLETMMHPVFDQDDVDGVRRYFTDFVLGRGFLPAIRVGRQPYGVLPTTAYSRINWLDIPRNSNAAHDPDLVAPNRIQRAVYTALKGIEAEWSTLAAAVPRVGSGGDPQQRLLDIVGLHPGSVEYHQRLARSAEELFHTGVLQHGGINWNAIIEAMAMQAARDELTKAGYAGTDTPDLFSKFFQGTATPFPGPVIDDRPLSESDPVRVYATDNRNYLAWLLDAANTSFDTLRTETGFLVRPPTAMLYVFLRHALQLGYWDTSVRLHETAQLIDRNGPNSPRREENFLGIRAAGPSGSRYELLYGRQAAVTGSQTVLVADFISREMRNQEILRPEYQLLRAQLAALETLKDLPTARLERLFTESLDCCSYRYDAWIRSLVEYRLTALRHPSGEGADKVRRGVHLGAYSWLEEVRPKSATRTPVTLTGELASAFEPSGAPARARPPRPDGQIFSAEPAHSALQSPLHPLMRDSSNAGYIHAPSLDHAVTAAVLRNGFLANAVPLQPDLLAVNLSSERVREAVSVLEGLREGQSLSALLGYRLEAGLHNRHGQPQLNEVIYLLRDAFPLRANRMVDSQAPAGTPLETVDARNVLDGLSLIDQIRGSGSKPFPFGVTSLAAAQVAAPLKAAIDAEVDRLLDVYDALADIALAEGVHQVVLGNYTRAGANLDAFAKAGFPTEPEVVRTPRKGINLEHRVALHLGTEYDGTVSPLAGLLMTPRASAEPALNAWLAQILPPPQSVACKVRYRAPGSTAWTTQAVTQYELGLQPIDLLFCAVMGSGQAMGELDDRVALRVLSAYPACPDAGVEIHYSEAIPNYVSFFELSALLRNARELLLRSRVLMPADMFRADEAEQASASTIVTNSATLLATRASLAALQTAADAYIATLTAKLADLPAQRSWLLDQVDRLLFGLTELLLQGGQFALSGTGWGGLLDWRARAFADLRKSVGDRAADWTQKFDAATARIGDYNTLPFTTPEDWRITELQRAERLISTSLTDATTPSSTFFAALVVKRNDFDAKRQRLIQLEDTPRTLLSSYLADVKTEVSGIAPFDLKPFDTEPLEQRILAFEGDLLDRAKTLTANITAALARFDTAIAAFSNATPAKDRLQTLDAAAKAVFGEDFRIIPQFTLPPAAAQEIQNAVAAATSGGLLDHARTVADIAEPVDFWLTGAARVREKIARFEAVTQFCDALGGTPPELIPLQLPYDPTAPWLALEFPPDQSLEGGHLLYTAHFASPFQAGQNCCGLVLDEWSEVVPGAEEMTGIAFQIDQSNGEAPQALLLVTPPDVRGNWQWDDIVDSLNETLDLAKKRAVEPTQLESTMLARFVPAVILATTLSGMTISANYLSNLINSPIGAQE